MNTILASSDTLPLDSVIICCTTITTVFNILSRGKLFTLGAQTDWPIVWCSYWGKGRRDPGFHYGGTCHCHLMCLRLLLFLCTVSERCHEGHNCSGEVGRERPSPCSPGWPLQLPFLHLLRMSESSIIGEMRFFSLRQPTVTAYWGGRYISFLSALVQVSARITSGGEVACSLPRRGRIAGSYSTV
jgi:hypothetical protein